MNLITAGFPVELELEENTLIIKEGSTPIEMRIIACQATDGYDIAIQADACFNGDIKPEWLKNVVTSALFVAVEDAGDESDAFGNGGNYAVIHLGGVPN